MQPGFGVPDQVVLPDEWSMLISYVVLAATFTAAAVLLLPYDWQWDSPGAWMLSALKAIVTLLAVFAWPNILVYPYEVRCTGGRIWDVRNVYGGLYGSVRHGSCSCRVKEFVGHCRRWPGRDAGTAC